jgi:hypothetical protein
MKRLPLDNHLQWVVFWFFKLFYTLLCSHLGPIYWIPGGEYGKPTRDQIGYFRLVRRHRETCRFWNIWRPLKSQFLCNYTGCLGCFSYNAILKLQFMLLFDLVCESRSVRMRSSHFRPPVGHIPIFGFMYFRIFQIQTSHDILLSEVLKLIMNISNIIAHKQFY